MVSIFEMPIDPEVTIAEVVGEWHVYVRDHGTLRINDFIEEQYAESFAEGARRYLALDEVKRV
jgi:hypothetical protein